MPRNYLEKLNTLWLSRNKENPAGDYATTNLMRQVYGSGSLIDLERKREDDRDWITGVEGPTQIWETLRTAKGKVSQEAALPDFLAFVFGFWYGADTSTKPGTLTYQHAATPLSSNQQPTFTGYQRLGNTIYSERFSGLGIDGFEVTIGQGFIKASADIAGWGKSQVDYLRATGVLTSATSITLAKYLATAETASDGSRRAMGGNSTDLVSGATEADRLANIDLILVTRSDGTKIKITPTACTAPVGQASVITLPAQTPVLAGTEAYEIVYLSAEADTWKTAPSLNQESPLKLSDASLLVQGLYDGTQFTGGYSIDLDWSELTIKGANSLAVDQVPGLGKIYGSRLERKQRILTFTLGERAKTAIAAARIDEGVTMSLQINVQGAAIETGYKYGFKMMVPSVGILSRSVEIKDKLLAQKGDLIALEDPVYGIGKVLTFNKQTSYV